MKRSLDSDNDDLYDDDDDDLKHGSPTQSYQMSDRKKRRGVIEKRRRDRINNSLTELRRLVPAAFEKQGSAKLEKAEILKMAVDHLKTLNSKGLGGGYGVDTAALAMDYRMIGFRECLTEVSRYLVSIEGLDVQDPLRLRVMNHLQCYCAQRESALAKASLHPGGNAWPEPSTPYYPPAPVAGRPLVPGGHMPTGGAVLGGGPVEPMASHPPYLQDSPGAGGLTRMTHANNDPHHNRLLPSSGPPSLTLPPTSQQLNPSPYTPTSLHVCNPPTMLSGIPPSVHTPFFGSMPMLSPNGLHYNPAAPMGLGQGVRPYRPWGSDLVY